MSSQEQTVIILIALVFIAAMVVEMASILLRKCNDWIEERRYSDYEQIEKPAGKPQEKY